MSALNHIVQRDVERKNAADNRDASAKGERLADTHIATTLWAHIRAESAATYELLAAHEFPGAIAGETVTGYEKRRRPFGRPYVVSLTETQAFFSIYAHYEYSWEGLNAIRYSVWLGEDMKLYANDHRLAPVPVRRRPDRFSPTYDEVFYELDENNMRVVNVLEDVIKALREEQILTVAPTWPGKLLGM